MTDVYKKLRGFIGTIFRLGNKATDPQIKVNAGIPEIRNSGDTGYEILRVDTPVDDYDAANKLYVDGLTKPLIMADQVNTSGSFPNNTAARRFLVVTTPGNGAVIGDVLYDNGLNDAQPMTILNGGPQEGRFIAITDTLSGGSITFDADSTYIWDADTLAWAKIGDIGSVTGAVRVIRIDFTFANIGSTVDSTAIVPANAIAVRSDVVITTAFNGTTPTITVGRSGSLALLQGTTDNTPTVLGQYTSEEAIEWGGAADEASVTLAGGGGNTQGVGYALIHYTNTNT